MKKIRIFMVFLVLAFTCFSLFLMLFLKNFINKKPEEKQVKIQLPDLEKESPVEDVKPVINQNPTTFCNPINISYQYQEGYFSRESADPAVILFKDEYYLFASHGSGYWWSDDLLNWNFIYTSPEDMPEIDKFAPAVCVIGDTMYLTHSGSGSIYKSSDPKSGKWEYVSHPVSWDDPALFVDDDGRVYCYYGCSNSAPIYVVELDPSNHMALLQGPVECFYSNGAAHGFEVAGDYNTDDQGDCWMEGAWMTKYQNTYYLQYAVPGTQYASYSDGCYTSKSPMGPFTFCDNSPVAYKSTGFIRGAGHGSLLQDLRGNWWKFDTVSISVNHMFERRLAMFPAKFDSYDQLITNSIFADYPMYLPTNSSSTFEQPGPDWNLVSYLKKVSASSVLDGSLPENAVDENMRTWWSANTGEPGEWFLVDLGKLCKVNAVQVNFADQSIENTSGRDNNFCYRYLIEYSKDGSNWLTFVDKSNNLGEPYKAQDTSHDYYELEQGIDLQYLRITNKGKIPAGGVFSISGLRLFGHGYGEAPTVPTGLKAIRSAKDERSVTVSWNPVDQAEGYIIRYGNNADSYYIHSMIIGSTNVELHNLNLGVDYYFTVASYNDSGKSKGTEVVFTPATKPAPTSTPPSSTMNNKPFEIIDGFEVYEAENGNIGNGAISSSGSEDKVASGGRTVHNMHLPESFIEISDVDGGPGGEGILRLCFANGNASSKTEIFINGSSIGTYTLMSTGGWSSFQIAEIPVKEIKAGKTNSVKFVGGMEGYNPDFLQFIW